LLLSMVKGEVLSFCGLNSRCARLDWLNIAYEVVSVDKRHSNQGSVSFLKLVDTYFAIMLGINVLHSDNSLSSHSLRLRTVS